MSLLQESVNALTAAAGWKKASPGADGVFRFRLEGDLDMEFFSPDGRTGILRADLGPLPDAEQDAEDVYKRQGRGHPVPASLPGNHRHGYPDQDGVCAGLHGPVQFVYAGRELGYPVRYADAYRRGSRPVKSPFAGAAPSGWFPYM